ncbi:reverse transcriptase domain-containing protein [Tanacetum coccineum]|uniref:Reverse transcriptase domain-containing protein n=1 Tax=Tanacetum coccineum TaxID=301880 RepID=A0ABQ4ZPV6_9ASTR
MEKLILALVHAVRRLRRYFQAHTVEIIMDQPIRQILSRKENSGRLAKWALELGEHAISYRPKKSIKGQILADFLAELPTEKASQNEEAATACQEAKEVWKLFTDGLSNEGGSGAGLILTSPDGVEFTYALCFEFKASNNKAEYEALLSGLRIAESMGVKHIEAFVDSKLIANQINDLYQAKEDAMQRYLSKAKDLITRFRSFSITQVPRSQNKQVDALSKMAFISFAHLTKKVLVEVLPCKSIEEIEIMAIVEETGNTWMTPIKLYLENGTLLKERGKAWRLRARSKQYALLEGTFYRESFLEPWLRCVGPEHANYVIQEIHEGSCSMHSGPKSVVTKAMQLGYYWMTMHTDARMIIKAF